MNVPASALLLAGFVLAHAAWNVSDLPKGDLLVPMAMVEKGGQRQLIRYEAETQEKAIAKGKAEMAGLGPDVEAWAFARDGVLRGTDGSTVDVLTIDLWAKGMKSPAQLIQRYEPFAQRSHFQLLGDPMVMVDGRALEPKDAKALLEIVLRGVQQHPKAAALWQGWRGATKR